jgi:hypothetical protein
MSAWATLHGAVSQKAIVFTLGLDESCVASNWTYKKWEGVCRWECWQQTHRGAHWVKMRRPARQLAMVTGRWTAPVWKMSERQTAAASACQLGGSPRQCSVPQCASRQGANKVLCEGGDDTEWHVIPQRGKMSVVWADSHKGAKGKNIQNSPALERAWPHCSQAASLSLWS